MPAVPEAPRTYDEARLLLQMRLHTRCSRSHTVYSRSHECSHRQFAEELPTDLCGAAGAHAQ